MKSSIFVVNTQVLKTAFEALGLPAESGRSAFDWRRTPEPAKPLTSEEKNRIQTRERMARARAVEKANRVNRSSGLARSTNNDKAHALRRGNSVIGA